MKKLHIFLIRSFLQPFFTTFFIVLFILLMLFLFKYIDDLIGKSFSVITILQLLFYANLYNVTLALPLAVLLASIMTFGDLGEKYELVAIKSAGISLQRAMFPLIIVMGMLTGVAFYFSNVVSPFANWKMGVLLYDVSQLKPNFLVKPGVFNNDLGMFTIRAESKVKDSLKHLMIYDQSMGSGNTNVILAESGKMVKSDDDKFLIFSLNNGVRYSEQSPNNSFNPRQQFIRFRFGTSEQKFPLEGFKLTHFDQNLFRNSYMVMNIRQLKKGADSIKKMIAGNNSQMGLSITTNFSYFNLRKKMDTLGRKPLAYREDILSNEKDYSSKVAVINTALGSMRNIRAYIPNTLEVNKTESGELRKYQVEYQHKFSMALACLVFFFIGAPLGAIIRKGGLGLPMVMSILFFLIFQILMSTGEKYSKSGVWHIYQGVWLATFVLVPIGIFLTYKASTDSQIFDIQNYLSFFKSLIFWRKKETKT